MPDLIRHPVLDSGSEAGMTPNYMIRFYIIIILLFPFVVSAHGSEASLLSDPGKLPGEIWYWLERPAEWIQLNLLTVSTKKKQEKRLQFASERAAEFGALLYLPSPQAKNFDLALGRYRYFLGSAEDMAEVIIFLDGHEIAVAEKFEETTRQHEKFFREQKESGPDPEFAPLIDDMLNEARSQNEKIFRFMVEKYQGSDQDIKKHQTIVSTHIALVREVISDIKDQEKLKLVNDLLTEAEKFRKAGLNLEAYDLVAHAKNLVY